MAKNNYTSIDIQDGLIAVRENPGMYLGSTTSVSTNHSPTALIQMAQEVLSNSVDEFNAGYGNEIYITIAPDNEMTISDNGRGIPKGVGQDFTDVINACTKLHASGKFNAESYGGFGVSGMHGIGLKAANAMSKYLIVEVIGRRTKLNNKKEKVFDNKLDHYLLKMHLEEILEQKIIKTYTIDEQLSPTTYKVKETDDIIKTGTTVKFLPDNGPISNENSTPNFQSIHWMNRDLIPRFESACFLNDGLKIVFTDERYVKEDKETGKQIVYQKTWQYEDGLTEYINLLSDDEDTLPYFTKPFTIKNKTTEIDGHTFELSLAMKYISDIYSRNIISYANGVPTKDGGTHVKGFENGLLNSLNNYGLEKKLIKEKFKLEDVKEGLLAVFSVKVPAKLVSFNGQSKDNLGTALASNGVAKILQTELTNWLYDNEDNSIELIKHLQLSKDAKKDAQKKVTSKNLKNKDTKIFESDKLKKASSKNPDEIEFLLTEGESASNLGRNPKFQSILGLRGKIKNVTDLGVKKVLQNEEVSTIFSVLGAGFGDDFDIKKLKCGKVIIVTDADADGGHIKTLLIGLFYKYARPLIEAGKLYVVIPPLYRATKYINGKPDIKIFYTESEINAKRKELQGYEIQRYKGLGEMGKDETKESICDPKTRLMVQVTIDDLAETTKMVNVFLGSNSELRKQWLIDNISFGDEIAVTETDRKEKEMDIIEIMSRALSEYSTYVILNRAIPDVRDGLKPVQRRILWATQKARLYPESKHVKLVSVVGDTMKHYHPHGDSSIESAVINMAQPWKTEPLIDIHGNKGSIDGSPAAASRYISARQSRLARLLLNDIQKNCVKMIPNFDGQTVEPSYLPAAYPNSVINASSGIAWGLANKSAPHNFSEVMKACIDILKGNPVKPIAPDFPTGGILVGDDGIKDEFETGKAKYTIRAKINILEKEKALEIVEFPFGLTTDKLIDSLKNQEVKLKALGFKDYEDSTVDDNDISIKLYFKKDADLKKVENFLYKKTVLQSSYAVNNTLIHNKKPEVISIRKCLEIFLDFRLHTLQKIWKFDKEKVDTEIEIKNGLLKLLDITDEIIELAKKSKNKEDLQKLLMEVYNFTQLQSEHIATLPIHRLGKEDLSILQKTLPKLKKESNRLNGLLTDNKKANNELIADLEKSMAYVGEIPRKTEIIDSDEIEDVDIKVEDLIEKKLMKVVVKKDLQVSTIGVKAFDNQYSNYKDDDIVTSFDANTTDYIYILTKNGLCATRLVNDLPQVNLSQKVEVLNKQIKNILSNDEIVFGGIYGEKVMTLTNYGMLKVVNTDKLLPSVSTKSYFSKSKPYTKFKNKNETVMFATNEITRYSDVEITVKNRKRSISLSKFQEREDGGGGSGIRISSSTKDNPITDYKFIENL